MYKKTLRLSSITITVGVILLSCNTRTENIEEAKTNLTAKQHLNVRKETYLTDIKIYRTETNEKVVINNLSITSLKKRIENDKEHSNSDYYVKVGELDRENNEMKRIMDNYTPEGKENWEAFKFEFNLGMDKIENSLEILSTKI
jgi:hypothetical protein